MEAAEFLGLIFTSSSRLHPRRTASNLASRRSVYSHQSTPEKEEASMSQRLVVKTLVCCIALFYSTAKAQMPKPYGAPITLENAKKAAAAAIAEVRKNNWTMAVAITDTAGHLVY